MLSSNNYSTSRFYDRLMPVYYFIAWFLKKGNNKIDHYLSREVSGKLLIIGVGAYQNWNLAGKHSIIAIDISSKVIQSHSQMSDDVVLKQMDGESLLFPDGCMDYISITHVLSVTSNPGQMLREANRVLKSGGKIFLLNHHSRTSWAGWLDRFITPLGRLLHFQTFFKLEIGELASDFDIITEEDFGNWIRYKLIIIRKK